MWKLYHSFLCGCHGYFHVLIWLGHSAWIFGYVVNYYKCLCEVLFCCLIHIPFWSVCVESSLGFFFFLIESQFIFGWCAAHYIDQTGLKLTKFYPCLSLRRLGLRTCTTMPGLKYGAFKVKRFYLLCRSDFIVNLTQAGINLRTGNLN